MWNATADSFRSTTKTITSPTSSRHAPEVWVALADEEPLALEVRVEHEALEAYLAISGGGAAHWDRFGVSKALIFFFRLRASLQRN
jgi:hypothetical protein